MAAPPREHSAALLLRFEPEQLDMIDQAAENSGLNRTSWIRLVVLREVKKELGVGERRGELRPFPCMPKRIGLAAMVGNVQEGNELVL